MSNILPLPERQAAWDAARARVLFLTGLALLAGALLAILALLPSAAVARNALMQAVQDVSAQQPRSEDGQALVESQALIVQMQSLLGTSTPIALIADVLAKRPPKTTVTHITYTPGTLVVSGAAARRDDVNAFRAAVAADTRFSSVTVPINALVGVEDGAFTMTISGAF